MFKKKKETQEPEDKNITINEEITDFRYIVPHNPIMIDFSLIQESNREFVKEGKIDDGSPNYREPLIDATYKAYCEYLDGHKEESLYIWRKILGGALAQKLRCQAEIDYIDNIPFDEIDE